MAQIQPLGKFILSWEGGYINDPNDSGGATNKGVTIAVWRNQGYDKNGDGVINVKDLKLISDDDAIMILRKNYWNRWQGNKITSQPIANILVDWVWGSGTYGIKIPQQMLGCKADGIVGSQTLARLNKQDPKTFFGKLKTRRQEYLQNLCRLRPSQKKYLKGWLRRLNAIQYTRLVCNNGRVVTW